MALTQATSRDYELGEMNEFLLLVDTIVHEGAAVGLNRKYHSTFTSTTTV